MKLLALRFSIFALVVLLAAEKVEANETTVVPPDLTKMSKAFVMKPEVDQLRMMRELPPDPEFSYKDLKAQQKIIERHLEKAPIWFLRYLLVIYQKTEGEQRGEIEEDLFRYGLQRNPENLINAFGFEQPASPTVFTNKFIVDFFLRENETIRECKKKCANLKYDIFAERIERIKSKELQGHGETLRKYIVREVQRTLKGLEAEIE